jgi:hypothetical protein
LRLDQIIFSSILNLNWQYNFYFKNKNKKRKILEE